MIARATLDKKYSALYNFPLYYLSSDRLRELRKKSKFQIFNSKSGHGRLREVSVRFLSKYSNVNL